MNLKFYFVLMILTFLVNFDLTSGALSCLKCIQKCKAADKKPISCNFEIFRVAVCFSEFESAGATDGAKRGCRNIPKWDGVVDGCTSDNICYCLQPGCNNKDSYKEILDGTGGKPMPPEAEPPKSDKNEDDTGDKDGVSRISSNFIFIFALMVFANHF